jgi:hypothetical protein
MTALLVSELGNHEWVCSGPPGTGVLPLAWAVALALQPTPAGLKALEYLH